MTVVLILIGIFAIYQTRIEGLKKHFNDSIPDIFFFHKPTKNKKGRFFLSRERELDLFLETWARIFVLRGKSD